VLDELALAETFKNTDPARHHRMIAVGAWRLWQNIAVTSKEQSDISRRLTDGQEFAELLVLPEHVGSSA
jgi:hypothetical protein